MTRQISFFIIAVAMAGCGALAWGVGDLAGLSVFAFFSWALARTRAHAFVYSAAYYLGGSWVIPDASRAFFADSWSFALGLSMWIAAGLLNALPWALMWPKHQTAHPLHELKGVLVRIFFLAVLITLPPSPLLDG